MAVQPGADRLPAPAAADEQEQEDSEQFLTEADLAALEEADAVAASAEAEWNPEEAGGTPAKRGRLEAGAAQ